MRIAKKQRKESTKKLKETNKDGLSKRKELTRQMIRFLINAHQECKDHSKLLSGIHFLHLETVLVNGE